MRNILLFFLFISGLELGMAQDQVPELTTGYIYPSQTRTIKEVLLIDGGIPENLLTPDYIDQVRRWNPRINPEAVASRLYVEIPYGTPIIPYSNQIAEIKPVEGTPILTEAVVEDILPPEVIESEPPRKDLGLNIFYMTSFGSLAEKSSSASATSKQNSPITLGLSYMRPLSDKYTFATSAYLSYLTASDTNIVQEVDVPLEYGLNAYINFEQAKLLGFTPFVGIDIENLSSFNTDEISLGEDLATRQHTLFYATAGIVRPFNIFKRNALFKTSASYSFASTSSRESKAKSGNFSGLKYMLFTSVNIKGAWSASLLFKQHYLSGPTDLVITRYGLGIGYQF